MSGKRTRTSNYNALEVHALLNLVYNYKDIIECKKTDHSSNKEKDNCWKEVSKIFNNSCNTSRSKEHLKSKWESLKKLVRKEIAATKNSQKTTGDGPGKTELTSVQKKVLLIIGVNGIGHTTRFSCDKEELNENVTHVEEDTALTSSEGDVPCNEWNNWNQTSLIGNQDVHLDIGESYSLVSGEEIKCELDFDKSIEQENSTEPKEIPSYWPKHKTEKQIYTNLVCFKTSLVKLQIDCTKKEFEKKQELMNMQIAIAEEEKQIATLKRKKIDLEILLLEEELKKVRRN